MITSLYRNKCVIIVCSDKQLIRKINIFIREITKKYFVLKTLAFPKANNCIYKIRGLYSLSVEINLFYLSRFQRNI